VVLPPHFCLLPFAFLIYCLLANGKDYSNQKRDAPDDG
jgi:hypothetical protein